MDDAAIRFSCSSQVFDVIKIRKEINVLPVKVVFGMDWDRRTQERSMVLNVRDRILDGEVQVEPHPHWGPLAIYRKHVSAPGIGRVDVRAGLALKGFKGEPWRPFFGVAYNLGGSNDTRLTADGIDFKQRVPLAKRLRLEVCGNVQLPLPAAQYQAGPEGSSTIDLGEGPLALHIAELNPIIYV